MGLGEFTNLSDWGEEFLKTHADKIIYAQLFSWWDELVGPQISAVSRPVYFKNATLHIDVKDHHWLNELRYHLPDIIKKYQRKILEFVAHEGDTTKKVPQLNEIKLKYNPKLTKSIKKNEIATENSSSSEKIFLRTEAALEATLKANHKENYINKDNVDEKLNQLLAQMKKHVEHPVNHISTSRTAITRISKISNNPENDTLHQEHSSPVQTKRTTYSTADIDRYYPRNDFYSEFIFPPDELQNFDLY